MDSTTIGAAVCLAGGLALFHWPDLYLLRAQSISGKGLENLSPRFNRIDYYMWGTLAFSFVVGAAFLSAPLWLDKDRDHIIAYAFAMFGCLTVWRGTFAFHKGVYPPSRFRRQYFGYQEQKRVRQAAGAQIAMALIAVAVAAIVYFPNW